jgi:general secretion pathway protein I
VTRSRGFTLLEVLVAFAILALSIVALYQVMGTGESTSAKLARTAPALALAESLLAEATTAPRAEPAARTGDNGPWRWRVVAVPYADAEQALAPGLLIVRVRVEVARTDRPERPIVFLEQLAFARTGGGAS